MITLADIFTPEVLEKMTDCKKDILKCETGNEAATRLQCDCECKDYPVERGGKMDSESNIL